MEAGGKDCEEETLQTAFKKLRVDAESSLSCTVNVSEALAPRAMARPCTEASGAKPKLNCPKDNWHGCMRKTSRGASRSQRRRRSKSPILQLPKFTYCSNVAAALSPSSGRLKHQRLADRKAVETCPGGDGRTPSAMPGLTQKDLSSSNATCHTSPPVFGASAGYKPDHRASCSPQEIPTIITTTAAAASRLDGEGSGAEQPDKGSSPERGVSEGAERGATQPRRPGPAEAADFQSLSKLHSSGFAAGPCPPCSCAPRESPDPAEGQGAGAGVCGGGASQCRCTSRCRSPLLGWQGVEVYSFTGLRDVISECKRNLPGPDDASHLTHSPPRTLSNPSRNTTTPPPATSPSPVSGSPRSCSEQARAYVDDITIEDLSGYMEYYLYIPKKMSHMAEMMYT